MSDLDLKARLRAMYSHRGDGIPTQPVNPDGDEAADRIAELEQSVIAFAGPWAVQYARDFGLPDGHLHPTHYDILADAGANMSSFTRAVLKGDA